MRRLTGLWKRKCCRWNSTVKSGKLCASGVKRGATAAAATYLSKQYPDVQGFSPRNLRRMRDFYRIYENDPQLLSLALQLGWMQNVVILEADLPMELREWYLRATSKFHWPKAEIIKRIANNAHEVIFLAIDEEACYLERQENADDQKKPDGLFYKENTMRHLIQRVRSRVYSREKGARRWPSMSYPMFTEKRIIFMRC